MKYIITENRLNQIVSKYLNGKDWHTIDIEYGDFDVALEDTEDVKLKFRNQTSSMDPEHEFSVLYIDDDLISFVIAMFSLNPKDAAASIINWFNEKYDKNLTMNDWEWFMKDSEDYPHP